jgi:histidinol dehydrogenase
MLAYHDPGHRYARPLVLRRLDLRGAGLDLRDRLPRPTQAGAGPLAAVQEILADVQARGDEAVRDLTEKFDGTRPTDLRVPPSELAAALERIPAELREALTVAAGNIRAYHETQLVPEITHERDGIVVRDLRRPVDRAGHYVPGGRATYPSTVLMTAVPARVAGVPELVLCVPPGRDGRVSDEVLAAAAIAGVDELYAIGGAQAIAAMAYGTESIRPVDVIVGPGNVYVALAKREVAGTVGIPSSFAGPSEVVVVADGSAPAAYAAVDVVLQAEHGPDGLAWLVTWDEAVADAVTAEVARIVEASPRRADIEATLAEGGYAVVCDGPEQAMAVANAIAPEHLELMTADPDALLPLVRHAGAVFCGPWSPASVGDYLAGPNHVLPTNGSARFSEALRVDDFVKHVHVVTLDEAALAKVAPHVAALAEAEGLAAHADSVRARQR